MFLTIFINYIGALSLGPAKDKIKKVLLSLTVLADLSFLFYFKYFNFVIENINTCFSTQISLLNIVLPLGISFYTFQAISYLIDVYKNEVKAEKNIFNLALYICLFPQLIAGPIVKYHDINTQIKQRDQNFEKIVYGIKRFIIGLAKKVLLANTLGAVADKIFEQPVTDFDALTAWIGAFAYSFQIFYDFSGYSDMAIGLVSIFGFTILENFNYPYISKSVTEFWRRWHISLSTWFKEYLYIPLGGNRGSKKRNIVNLMVVFLVTGFWHGAAWNFVIWGAWHGFFIVFEKLTGLYKKENSFVFSVFQHVYCLFVVLIGWIMFKADNVNYAFKYLKNMFGIIVKHDLTHPMVYYVDNTEIIAFVVAFLCSTPVFSKILNMKEEHYILKGVINIWLILLFIVASASIATSTYNPFIYFRF